jgi:hypothetical protein
MEPSIMEKKTGYLSFVLACVVTVLLASMLLPPGILPVIEAVRRWLTDCVWRREAESNRRYGFCRPMPYHLATAPPDMNNERDCNGESRSPFFAHATRRPDENYRLTTFIL